MVTMKTNILTFCPGLSERQFDFKSLKEVPLRQNFLKTRTKMEVAKADIS